MPADTAGQVRQAARVLFREGDVVEIRVPKAGKLRTISGYFSDPDALAREAAKLEQKKYPGVYWTLNPVLPSVIARSENHVSACAEHTTTDGEIVSRRWLPIDLDAVRPPGISSTDAEHDAALALSDEVRSYLTAEGWPDPVVADSGNGGHLLYAVVLPNDPPTKDAVKGVFEVLAAKFDTQALKVDRTLFNASRVLKTYGTTARKGSDTAERAHRLSRLLYVPETINTVPTELIRKLAAQSPSTGRSRSGGGQQRSVGAPFDLGEFLSRHGIAHRPPVAYAGGLKYVLDACPFDPSHKAPDSAVFERPDGSLGFKCLHNSCADYHWRQFRERCEGPRPVHQVPVPRPDLKDRVDPPPQCGSAAAIPSEAAAREVRDPLSLSTADIEAAVDQAIAADDLEAAMRLIPQIARTPSQSQALITAKLRKKFRPAFPSREFARALKEHADKIAEPPPPDNDDVDAPSDDEAPDLTTQPHTDSGNGERIVLRYGKDIRFCIEFSKWLVWEQRGACGRWKVDSEGLVTQKAKAVARLLYQQAKLKEDSLKRAMQKHARESESHAAIVAALKRAATEPGIAVSASDLDQHRYLLNCLNGVVDLRTGDLLPAERHYLITKLCHFRFNPEAKCPRFLKFINWTMGETDAADSDRVARLVGFLQKALGYSLTADVSEKAAFVCYGRSGNNGKTTLLTTFTTILAEYSTQLDINTLMSTKMTDNNMRADLAKLHGARLVITSEVDEHQKLSERLLKYLTAGMGKIVACRKFENPIEFDATHKIWIDCNLRPTVRAGDEAIWGRLMCVPFDQHLEKDDPEMDKTLKDKILAEAEGVLAWAIRGAMQWAKDGKLDNPPEVRDANTAWRDANDPLKDFLEDYCEIGDPDEGFWVVGARLSTAYDHWCKENKEKYPLGRSELIERLMQRGFVQSRSRRDAGHKQIRTWEGLRLRDDVTAGLGGCAREKDYSF